MAHDRMTNDELDRNMGGREGHDDDLGGQDFGKQTPGRNPDDQQAGKKGANKPAEENDDYSKGGQGRTPQGGQNR